ncbi:MAG TPA: hypothetical protein VL972_06735 [Solirubrobacteraceae bacterium]|nr:hypothetical protein [Solirubrobacteraceae bacterium]
MPNHHTNRPRRRPRTLIALAPALLAATLPITLASCGTTTTEDVTTKPAAQILAAATNAAHHANSVQITSKINEGKLHSSMRLQIVGTEGGSAQTSRGSRSSETIRVGGTVYRKVGPVLARQIAQATGAHVPVGSWVKAPASNAQIATSSFLTEPDGELLFLLRIPALSLTKGAITTVNGQKAIELKTKGKLYTGEIYIAATGTPYPIEIVKQPSGKGIETSHTTFTNWNRPIRLSLPPANAIDLSQLQQRKAG